MPDPMSLTALGGVAASEGIKFLYGQASELLRAWRERRQRIPDGEPLPTELPVPIIGSPALDAPPVQCPADAAVLDRVHRALVELSGALSPYAQGQVDIDLTDSELAERAGALRALLEGAYHQRFTFRGEEREPTGSVVTVRQALDVVEGHVVGAEADVEQGGDLRITQQAELVKEGGSVTGFKGTIGGAASGPGGQGELLEANRSYPSTCWC